MEANKIDEIRSMLGIMGMSKRQLAERLGMDRTKLVYMLTDTRELDRVYEMTREIFDNRRD